MAGGAEIHPEYTREGVGIGERNLAIATRLGAAAQAFFFVSFLFAFFYLRALNTAGRWNLHHLHPSRAYGIAILVCVLGSAGATWLAASSARGQNLALWRVGLGAAILLALAAIGLQCAQYANLGFGPGEGSFASVFVGWTGLIAVNILGVVYWLTTLLAETLNPRGRSLSLLRASAEAAGVYWGTLALIELTAFILLYVVGS
jgi:heme/copper-type cytochrome/quinol oxidase subunit 3